MLLIFFVLTYRLTLSTTRVYTLLPATTLFRSRRVRTRNGHLRLPAQRATNGERGKTLRVRGDFFVPARKSAVHRGLPSAWALLSVCGSPVSLQISLFAREDAPACDAPAAPAPLCDSDDLDALMARVARGDAEIGRAHV